MTHGFDTGFLVAFEVTDHPDHAAARARIRVQVFPTGSAVSTFADRMGKHRLGRNRLLDTILAATYFSTGITSVMTTNSRDFQVFGIFQIIRP